MAKRSVIVLSGRLPSLVAIRALSAAGLHVIAGEGGEYSLARHSRHCAETWPHPPIREGERFLEALVDHLEKRPDVVAVLPLQDAYVSLLTRQRDRLPAGVVVAAPNTEAATACLDKGTMYGIARELGVPHDAVERAVDLELLMAAADRVGFPCIIRPAAWTGPLPGMRKAVICRDRETLERIFAHWPERLTALLVQRYSPHPRINLYFVARGGRILECVQVRVLRTDRHDGTGLAVSGLVVSPDDRLKAYCDTMVERLRYTGVGNAQFLVPDHGEPRFLEINPRHGGTALAVARIGGLDLTTAALALAGVEGLTWARHARRGPAGRRYAWTSRDLYGAATALAEREIGAWDAARWVGGALGTAVRSRVHLTWARDDPMPTLAVYADLLSLRPWRRRWRR